MQVEENLVKVRNAGTEQDLGIQYKALKPEVDKLNMMAAKRQQVSTRAVRLGERESSSVHLNELRPSASRVATLQVRTRGF